MTLDVAMTKIQSMEKEIGRLESDINYIRETTIPSIFEKINACNNKVTALLFVWTLNAAVLGFTLTKIFEISSKLK